MSKVTELKVITHTKATLAELEVLRAAGFAYYTAKRGEISKPVKWYKTCYHASQAVQKTLGDLQCDPCDELVQCTISNIIHTIQGIIAGGMREGITKDLTVKSGYTRNARLAAIGHQLVNELKALHDYMYDNRGLSNASYSTWAQQQKGKFSRELRDMMTVKLYNNRLGCNQQNYRWLCAFVRNESSLGIISLAAQSRIHLLDVAQEHSITACAVRALKSAELRCDLYHGEV